MALTHFLFSFKSWLVLAVFSLLVWANWQEPNLHDYAPPVSFRMFRVEGIRDSAHATQVERAMVQVPGISSCRVNMAGPVVALSYDPEQVTEASLPQRFRAAGAVVQPYTYEPVVASGPQCPVPAGYVVALERLRFALNFRRLFIHV